MKTLEEITAAAYETIRYEAESVSALQHYADKGLGRAIQAFYQCKGRVIITGIGKSAIIARKIVATMNSTGTPAVFMHAADAIHGDLGIIQPDDMVMCLSKSGNTPEIKVLVPLIKRFGNTLVAMVSNTGSYLAQHADFVVRATVKGEACPNNLAPTSSTTAQLVMGDAIAVTLLRMQSFNSDDFARFHPGGALGKKLYLRVSDLYVHNMKPQVPENAPLEAVILEISSKMKGATAVLGPQNTLVGIITDGDLRRMLQQGTDLKAVRAADIMSPSPKTIPPQTLAIEAFNLMEANSITQLLVEEDGKYLGIVHLHDILKEGIV